MGGVSAWFWGAFLLLVWGACFPSSGWSGPPPSEGKVAAVFDGDTIQLETGERIRYLGIDAPEVAHGRDSADCYAYEAKTANSQWVLNKRVVLRYDRETRDSHGRLLAYVFLPDGRCVNEDLLRGGFAWVFRPSEGFLRWKEFVSCQRDALRSHRGMWGSCSRESAPSYVGNRQSFVFHRPDCPFGKLTAKKNRVIFSTRVGGLEEGFSPCRRCKP